MVKFSGYSVLVTLLSLILVNIITVFTLLSEYTWLSFMIYVSPSLIITLLMLPGFVIIKPNYAAIILFFGKYLGVIQGNSFCWIFPLCSKHFIPLKVHTSYSSKIKINDLSGHPIEIAACIMWRVTHPYKAYFEVDDFRAYLMEQFESALRTLGMSYPFEQTKESKTSLRRDNEELVRKALQDLKKRLHTIGVDVLEIHLTHLAYAPEIASAMLQCQEAEICLAAQEVKVQASLEIVKDTILSLEKDERFALDPIQKSSLLSNLMVTLCSERGVSSTMSMHNL